MLSYLYIAVHTLSLVFVNLNEAVSVMSVCGRINLLTHVCFSTRLHESSRAL